MTLTLMQPFPNAKFVQAGDTKLAYYEADGDNERQRPPVILVHGWPEIAYSWKNQIHTLSSAGLRVIAIDLKGFGLSDAPKDTSLYDATHMTADFCALLDTLNINEAVFCGHDWGGALVWSMGQRQPDRVAGIISLCTPLAPRAPAAPVSILKRRYTDKHYFVQFQESEWPEKLFATNPEKFFRLMFQGPAQRSRWASLIPGVFDLPGRFQSSHAPDEDTLIVSEEDLQIYVQAYKHSGFHGGVNLYRNVDKNWAELEGRNEYIDKPSLWIGAELDMFLPPESADGMEALVPDLEKQVISGCGHWVNWEKPDAVNDAIIDWINRRFSI